MRSFFWTSEEPGRGRRTACLQFNVVRTALVPPEFLLESCRRGLESVRRRHAALGRVFSALKQPYETPIERTAGQR